MAIIGKDCDDQILEKACHRLLADNCKEFGDVLGKVHMENIHLLPRCLAQSVINSAIENPHKIDCLVKSPYAELFLAMLVSKDGLALKYLPENAITPKLCLEAIKQNSLALKFVPEALKNYDICKVAVARDGMALQYVPECLRTYRICYLAIDKNGLALEFVPIKLKNPLFCIIAYTNNIDAIKFFPPNNNNLMHVLNSANDMFEVRKKMKAMREEMEERMEFATP